MSTVQVRTNQLIPNPQQPRTLFDKDELQGLAQSIQENGLINPVVVERGDADDQYIIIDGERRWRAHQLAGLEFIDIIVRPAKSKKSRRLADAMVANIQRASMGFVDEAKAYQQLIAELGSIDAVAKKMGVHVVTVSSRLSLLELSETAQQMCNARKLPFDTSVIAAFKRLSKADQDKLASMAVTRGWKTPTILRFGAVLYTGKPRKERKKKIVVQDGEFDAFSMASIDPANIATPIRTAVQATCKACPLYQEASPKVCNQCPLPDFLNRVGRHD